MGRWIFFTFFFFEGELTSAQSIAFSGDGKLLYCGFNRYIQVFSVEKPGCHSERRPRIGSELCLGSFLALLVLPSKYISYCLLEKPDQGGIISALTALQGVDSSRGLYAAGSFGGSVGVYSESNGGKRVGPLLQGPRLGVSQVKFAVPASGATPWLLVAGGRADSEVE